MFDQRVLAVFSNGRLAYGRMLFKRYGGEVTRKIDDRYWRIDHRRVDLDLSNVRITTVLMVRQNGDLNEKCPVLAFVLL